MGGARAWGGARACVLAACHAACVSLRAAPPLATPPVGLPAGGGRGRVLPSHTYPPTHPHTHPPTHPHTHPLTHPPTTPTNIQIKCMRRWGSWWRGTSSWPRCPPPPRTQHRWPSLRGCAARASACRGGWGWVGGGGGLAAFPAGLSRSRQSVHRAANVFVCEGYVGGGGGEGGGLLPACVAVRSKDLPVDPHPPPAPPHHPPPCHPPWSETWMPCL